MSVGGEATVAAPPDRKLALAHRLQDAGDGEALKRAMRFAALSGRFQPDAALRAAGFPPPGDAGSELALERLAVVAKLVDACDTRLWAPDWIMRAPARERCIAGLADNVAQAVAWRREQQPLPPTAADICNALLGVGAFKPAAIERVLSSDDRSPETFEQLIRGLTLALPLAPGRGFLDPLRAALAKVQAAGKTADADLIGREHELATIADSIARQWAGPASGDTLGAVYVAGEGSVGKSALLAEVRRLHAAEGAVCVVLDFTRPGIEGSDPLSLSREFARQVSEEVGAPGGRLLTAITAASSPAAGPAGSPRAVAGQLLGEVAAILRDTARPLLLIADALEMLTRYGDAAAFGFLEWLRMLKGAVPRTALVGAGRGPVPAHFAAQLDSLTIAGLPAAAARRIVGAATANEAASDALIGAAEGDPLLLRLGAKLVEQAPVPAGIALHGTRGEKAWQLYRLILANIADEHGRRLAEAGMLLRRVNAELLAQLVAPEVGIRDLTIEHARELLASFAQHAWLVEERDGWLVQSADQRLAMLDRQIAEHPEQARSLFAGAAVWHDQAGQPTMRLYYRLQGWRWRKRPPGPGVVPPALAARFTDDMVRELPPAAQDAIAVARGERSGRLRVPSSPSGGVRRRRASRRLDPAAADELRMLLHRERHSEAVAMIGAVRDLSGIDPASSAAAPVIEALWRAGDWEPARAMLARRRELVTDKTLGERDVAALCAAFAELDPAGFREAVRTGGATAELLLATDAKVGERPEWDVAALLIRAEGRESSSPFAAAVWTAWAGEPPTGHKLAEACLGMAAAGRGTFAEAEAGTPEVLALVLPDPCHTRMLQDRLQRLPGEVLALLPLLVAAFLRSAGGGDSAAAENKAASYAIDDADWRGLLAEVVTALALVEPNVGVSELARAARQRASTCAGYWSYGPVPQRWRQPATDWRTATVLRRFRSQRQAAEEVARWRAGYGTAAGDRLAPLVVAAEAIAGSVQALLGARGLSRRGAVAQRLIDAGLPLALAAPFAVLTAPHPSGTVKPLSNGKER